MCFWLENSPVYSSCHIVSVIIIVCFIIVSWCCVQSLCCTQHRHWPMGCMLHLLVSCTDTLLLMQQLNAQLPVDQRSTFSSWDSLSASIRAAPEARHLITCSSGMPPPARVPHRVHHGQTSGARTKGNQRAVHNDLYTVSHALLCTLLLYIAAARCGLHALCNPLCDGHGST